jgi:hypothetical protein
MAVSQVPPATSALCLSDRVMVVFSGNMKFYACLNGQQIFPLSFGIFT